MSNVMITGCSSGFGHLTALTCARRGDHVIATARQIDRLESLIEVAESEHLALTPIALDVRSEASVREAVNHAETAAGGIDAVVNNAGYLLRGSIEDTDDRSAQDLFDTNFFGSLRVIRAVLPGMRAQRHGVVVQVSSLAGIASFPSEGLYGASKHAVEAVCETLQHEVSPHGIRVHLVEPGWFPTSMDDNAVRAVAATTDSPYRAGEDAFWAAVERLRTGAERPDPQAVADAIADVLHNPDSAFRTPVGTDSSTVTAVLHQATFEEVSATLHEVLDWSDPTLAVTEQEPNTPVRASQ